jgi:hypothetical protein
MLLKGKLRVSVALIVDDAGVIDRVGCLRWLVPIVRTHLNRIAVLISHVRTGRVGVVCLAYQRKKQYLLSKGVSSE